jgi:hypothetical protein
VIAKNLATPAIFAVFTCAALALPQDPGNLPSAFAPPMPVCECDGQGGFVPAANCCGVTVSNLTPSLGTCRYTPWNGDCTQELLECKVSYDVTEASPCTGVWSVALSAECNGGTDYWTGQCGNNPDTAHSGGLVCDECLPPQ